MKIDNATQGGQLFDDTTLHSPGGVEGSVWGVIQILTDAKFEVLSGEKPIESASNESSGSAPLIPQGIILEGRFNALQLHSGSVVAYYA